MRFSSIIITVLAAATINGYVVDGNLPDGIYTVTSSDSAKTRKAEAATVIGDIVSANGIKRWLRASPLVNTCLDNCWIECETSTALNRFNFNCTMASLKSRCKLQQETLIPKSSHIFAKEGSSMVYACNWGVCNNPCRDFELDQSTVEADKTWKGEGPGDHLSFCTLA
ncbi:hypothetical protein DL770_008312 [Monosporascus sp. CRB-9-2]|nr:hypothetical protein DL770_008312 [Monosporascus sp. CRB-9-2]